MDATAKDKALELILKVMAETPVPTFAETAAAMKLVAALVYENLLNNDY